MKIALAITFCVTLLQLARGEFAGTQRFGGGSTDPGGWLTPEHQAALNAAYNALRQQELWEESLLAQEQQAQKEAKIAHEQEVNNQLEQIRQEAALKAQDVDATALRIKNLTKSILEGKKLISPDPWRQISGQKIYIKSYGSGFVKFNGVILQKTATGILVDGNHDGIASDFFVENFPSAGGYSDGDWLFAGSNYVALPDGFFTFISGDGSIQSVPKLNYGQPCSPPDDAAAIEADAQKFNPSEQQQINQAEDDLESKKSAAKAAAAEFQSFSQMVQAERESEEQAAIWAKNAPLIRALKYNQGLADKGDPYGLLRMGERYRDGEGVPKDLNKAREYLQKAMNAGDPTAAAELAKLNQSSAVNETTTLK